jgi:hypothetical protein
MHVLHPRSSLDFHLKTSNSLYPIAHPVRYQSKNTAVPPVSVKLLFQRKVCSHSARRVSKKTVHKRYFCIKLSITLNPIKI